MDEKGNLTKAGYAKRLLPVYDRTKVKGGKTRLKEWDYYYVGNHQRADSSVPDGKNKSAGHLGKRGNLYFRQRLWDGIPRGER